MKKAFYSLLYNVVVAAFPLVTLPLVIGRTSLSEYGAYLGSYLAYSVSLAVTVTAFSSSAGRTFVEAEEQGQAGTVFYSLLRAQLMLLLGSLPLYGLLVLIMSTGSVVGIIPLGLALASSFMNVDWYFYSIHDYKSILLRNVIIRGIGLAAIYYFVEGPEAISRFALIMAIILVSSNLLGLTLAWRRMPKEAARGQGRDAWKEIVRARHLLVGGGVAASYQQLDQVIVKTLLGEVAVAKLNVLKQMVYMACAVTNAYCRFQMPRGIRSLVKGGAGAQFRKSLTGFFLLMAAMGIVGIIGGQHVLNAVSASAGSFDLVDVALVAVCAASISLAVFTTTQVNIPLGQERSTVRANLLVAIVCLSLLFVLPSIYGYRGAMLSVVAGELLGLCALIFMNTRSQAWAKILGR